MVPTVTHLPENIFSNRTDDLTDNICFVKFTFENVLMNTVAEVATGGVSESENETHILRKSQQDVPGCKRIQNVELIARKLYFIFELHIEF